MNPPDQPDSGDDSLYNVRRLRTELTAEREKVRVLREDIEALAYVSRNHTVTRSQLRDMIAVIDQKRRALAATEGAK